MYSTQNRLLNGVTLTTDKLDNLVFQFVQSLYKVLKKCDKAKDFLKPLAVIGFNLPSKRPKTS